MDLRYKLDYKSHMLRKWGFRSGHFTEWAQLFDGLEGFSGHLQDNSTWLIPTTQRCFTVPLETAWDKDNGGICFCLALDINVCGGDKYFGQPAELFAAAGPANPTGNNNYRPSYDKSGNIAVCTLLIINMVLGFKF